MATSNPSGGQAKIIPNLNRLLQAMKLPPLAADVTMDNLAERLDAMATIMASFAEMEADPKSTDSLSMSNSGTGNAGLTDRERATIIAAKHGISLEEATRRLKGALPTRRQIVTNFAAKNHITLEAADKLVP